MDTNEKKIFELEQEKKLRDALDAERKESGSLYAVKLAEKAVFAIIGLMGLTIAGALIKVAISYIGMAFK